MLVRLWERGNTYSLLVRWHTGTARMEMSVVISSGSWELIYLKTCTGSGQMESLALRRGGGHVLHPN